MGCQGPVGQAMAIAEAAGNRLACRVEEPALSTVPITLRPHLKILAEPDRARPFHLLQKAESLCLVSRALWNNPLLGVSAKLGSNGVASESES
jgi:organic hydroperoxide reductase OsmC/OhrA